MTTKEMQVIAKTLPLDNLLDKLVQYGGDLQRVFLGVQEQDNLNCTIQVIKQEIINRVNK